VFSGKLHRKISSVDPYELIPVPLFPHAENQSGIIQLHIPKFKNEKFGNLFLSKKAKPHFVVELDAHGSRFYRHFNGDHTIRNILQLVASDGKEPLEQADERCFTYIEQLLKHQYITFKQLQT
jgi:hypothetical protein